MQEISNKDLIDAIVRIGANPHHHNKISQRHIIIKLLPLWFPECFKRGDAKVPLAIGVNKDLMEATGLTKKIISFTLARYCRNYNYLCCLVEGAPRYTLKGEISGVVTAEQHKQALAHLKKYQNSVDKQKEDYAVGCEEVADRVS
jgi:sRNA-binding protein